MASFKLFLALLGIIAVVYLLIIKKETKTVLIGVGLVLCLLCLEPMKALNAFTEYMVKENLIKAICASMGFAFVMKYTGCDTHLVRMLTNPLKNIGFFLIPMTTAVTYFINIAIPSAAGCSAAVGATLIPVLMSAGITPAMAGASVFAGTFGAVLSPGSAHNVFVASMVKKTVENYTVQDVIKVQFSSAMISLVIVLISISLVALYFKDYVKGQSFSNESSALKDEKINYLYAFMPLVPLIILIIGGTSLSDYKFLNWIKMGVAQAMIIGAVLAIIVTLTSPEKITKEFFTGMGSAYAEVMGIIIAAGVFVEGLKACGAIEVMIDWLKTEQHFVRFGGTFLPFIMGVVTGSGDAAAMAFNQAVTIHAQDLGFDQAKLGMAAAISGALGRTASPIAGAAIVCAGLAMVNPVQIAKRTALGMVISVLAIAFIIL